MSQKLIKSIKTYIKNDKALGEFDYAVSKDIYLASIKEFDQYSNVIKEIGYRPDGWIENHYTNKFNDNNQLIEHSVYDEDDQILETHTYDYSAEGKLIGIACYFAEMDDNDYTHIIYDAEDQIIEKRNMDSSDELYSSIKFEYQQGKLINEKHFNDENVLESEKQFQYDDKGNIVAESDIDHLENDKRVYTYEYNDAGKRTKTCIYNKKDQLIMRTSYEFDEDGRNIKQVEEDQKGIFTTLFGYNDDGLLDFQEKLDANDQLLVRWEYAYNEDLLVETGTYFREKKELIEEEDEDEYELVKRVSTDLVYEFYN